MGLENKVNALELTQQAKDAGLDEEKFKSQVEAAAQAKYDVRKGELDELLKAEKERAEKAESRVQELEARELDAWLEAELVKASIPEDVRPILERAAHTCPVHQSLGAYVEMPIEIVYE